MKRSHASSFVAISLVHCVLAAHHVVGQIARVVHPHVAPFDTPDFDPTNDPELYELQSPHFNMLDLVWNLGESFYANPDPLNPFFLGGCVPYYPYLQDYPHEYPTNWYPQFVGYVETLGWRMNQISGMAGDGHSMVYQGFLEPNGSNSGSPYEAAFQIVVPNPLPPPGQLCLLVHFPSTTSSQEPVPDIYPFTQAQTGLAFDTQPLETPYWALQGFIEARMVERTAGRPMWGMIERQVEIVGIARNILMAFEGREIDAVIARGTSFGAGAAAIAINQHPNVFHAALCIAAPGEARRYINQQELWNYVAAHSGGEEMGGYNIYDAVDWNQWVGLARTDWANASYLSRFQANHA